MTHVWLGDKSLSALEYIATFLRERDREEVFALRYEEDPARLAMDTFALGEFQWIAYADQTPAASIGAFPVWPGVWQCWAYGTDRWPEVVRTLTKHVRRFMRPALLNSDARRLQCWAMESHDDARKWLKFLGAQEEARLDNYGKNGQTFVCYSWRRGMTERTDVLRCQG